MLPQPLPSLLTYLLMKSIARFALRQKPASVARTGPLHGSLSRHTISLPRIPPGRHRCSCRRAMRSQRPEIMQLRRNNFFGCCRHPNS